MPRTAVLAVESVSQSYRGTAVLTDLSLGFGPGRCTLLGPNGAGKSTLLRILSTAAAPSAGAVLADGVPVVGRAQVRRLRREVGFLPQRFGFHPRMTVREFVEYLAWRREVPTRRIPAAAVAAIAAVRLSAQSDQRLGELSGGMLRRAGIAQALVHSPRFLLLDEPTIGLDPAQRVGLREVLRDLPSDAVVVLSTHLTDDVAALPGRVVVLSGGTVRFDAPTAQFLAEARPSRPVGEPESLTAAEAAYLAVLDGDVEC